MDVTGHDTRCSAEVSIKTASIRSPKVFAKKVAILRRSAFFFLTSLNPACPVFFCQGNRATIEVIIRGLGGRQPSFLV